jgi:hypothetical protein
MICLETEVSEIDIFPILGYFPIFFIFGNHFVKESFKNGVTIIRVFISEIMFAINDKKIIILDFYYKYKQFLFDHHFTVILSFSFDNNICTWRTGDHFAPLPPTHFETHK